MRQKDERIKLGVVRGGGLKTSSVGITKDFERGWRKGKVGRQRTGEYKNQIIWRFSENLIPGLLS